MLVLPAVEHIVAAHQPKSSKPKSKRHKQNPWQPYENHQVTGSVLIFRHQPTIQVALERNNHYNYDTYLLFIYFSFRLCLDRILRLEDKIDLF